MHPILFRIPLPGWTVPLMPALLGLAVLGALLGLFGWRKRAADLLVVGVALAIGGVIAALSFKGQVYTLSDLPIYSYGAMLCLSIVVGWYLTLGLAEKDGLPKDTMANCYFITAVAALIGARLLYVATNPEHFTTYKDVFALRSGGLVAYGGFLGGFVGSLWYLRRKRIRLLPWADVAVPSLATGLVITRLGCYLYGCDFGKPLAAGAPEWLIRLGTFPRRGDPSLPEGAGSPAWTQHVEKLGLSPDAEASLPVHPTQLYEMLAGVLLIALVFLVRKRQSFRGQVFLAFTMGYGLLRFMLEILRDDAERGSFGPHLAQHLILPCGLVLFGAAFAYGPARSIANVRLRQALSVLALVPGIVVYLLTRPESFAGTTSVQLSTSQWIALLTGIAAAVVWGVMHDAARKNPEAAMSLGEGAAEAPEDDEPGADEDSEESSEAEAADTPKPVAKKRKKKRRRRKPAKDELDGEPRPA